MKRVRRESAAIEAQVYFYSPYPGTELIREVEQRGTRLPTRLEDWDDFNIDRAWMAPNRPNLEHRVRNVNFYLRHGYSPWNASPGRRLLQTISKFRCDRDWYAFPLERYVAEAWRRRKAFPV
jgi:hypothetical protein